MSFKPHTLWKRITERTEQALVSGALLPVPTDHAFVQVNDVQFFVRVLASMARKDEARKQQELAPQAGGNTNPFLRPESALFVAHVSETHSAILNKFNVVKHHLLITTRRFEDQDLLLTPRDFYALRRCMAEYDSLGFYNGGREAGASQQHKHLQVVPLPLAPGGPAVPLEPLFSGAVPAGIGAVPELPFVHAFARLDRSIRSSPDAAAVETFRLYAEMLRFVGMTAPAAGRLTRQSMPYCLIVTSGWMLLVPRTQEHFEDISLNSLAFAGSFFLRTEQQLERLKEIGPMTALMNVALAKDSGESRTMRSGRDR